jgi:hypothetical protein
MILLYLGFYVLEFSFGLLWWTSTKLYNGFFYINKYKTIENTKIENDYIIVNDALRKDIIEIKELLKSHQ